MKSFKQWLLEAGGQEAGTLEIVKTSLEEARAWLAEQFKANGRDLDTELPNFDKNYLFAQRQAGTGKTLRKDMPVINSDQVRQLQFALSKGEIDLRKPFAKETNPKNPFPEGLSGEDANEWLQKGIKIYDGKEKDDQVKVSFQKVKIGSLKPIQKQIYLSKSGGKIASKGADSMHSSLQNTYFLISSDNHIIDGHHRFLAGILIDPSLMVQALVVDLPIAKLLPLTLAYGDAIGNQRNQ